MGDQASLDENIWTASGVRHRALTLRTFDRERRTWSIFWLDTRWPAAFGPPVTGGFVGDRGVFFGNDHLDEQPIRVRFDWCVDPPDACRWAQAFSFDDGATWQENWRMDFRRHT
jgi:hypothetical protein